MKFQAFSFQNRLKKVEPCNVSVMPSQEHLQRKWRLNQYI
ncbi:unnamed protein product [Victoria cruziana]